MPIVLIAFMLEHEKRFSSPLNRNEMWTDGYLNLGEVMDISCIFLKKL